MKILKNDSCFVCMTAIFAVLFVFTCPAFAATTFPVDQAGMAAYVKLNNITQANFDNARQNLFDSVESASSTYMIGVKEYSIDGVSSTKINFHIYFGTNGWLVAYLLKDQEPSRIVNWSQNAMTGKIVALDNTLLNVAIEDATARVGATTTTPIAYYDFAQPQAKKMTLIRESVTSGNLANDFSVTVPGTLYQASYSLISDGAINSWSNAANLTIDNKNVGVISMTTPVYGNYNLSDFTAGTNHTITLGKRNDPYPASAATLLLYSVN